MSRRRCGSVPSSSSLFAERVLPTARPRRRARRIGPGEIIKHALALCALDRRHVVASGHEREGFVPALPAHALRRHQFEIMAWRAGIERLLASRAGGIFFRALVAGGEGGGGLGSDEP